MGLGRIAALRWDPCLLIEAIEHRACIGAVHGGALKLVRCLQLWGHGGILQQQDPVQDLGHTLRCTVDINHSVET